MKPNTLLAIVVTLAVSGTHPLTRADEVKLKSGQTLTGKITYEADDIIKIEIPVNASIKETKILSRADVASIQKDAPDDVEFNRIQTLLPTGSLLQAEAYRQILATGPDAFLKNFPESKHTAKVQEIRATLAEELDKVERGYLKIENDWISPQDKIDFKELVDSRIRFLRMESFSKGGNYPSLIAAMREYEAIEEGFAGSPAYPKAVELARQVIPALGQQLQTLARDVDFHNAEYQKSLEASTPDARAQLIAAREREDKAIADGVAADKKNGVKWVQLNPRSKPALEDYLKLASSELARVRELDTSLLSKQAELLVEADKRIAANDIAGARAKVTEAAALVGQKTDAGSKSKSKSSKSSKSKGSGQAGSYLAVVNGKINARLAAEQEKAKAKAAASDSEALTANLAKSAGQPGVPAESPAAAVPAEGGTEAPAATATEGAAPTEEPKPEVDEFAALASSKSADTKSETKGADSKAKSPSKTKTKSSKSKATEEEKEEKSRPAAVEEEGGFPVSLIVPIITALLIVVVVVMKVLGIGGKKGEE